MKLIRTLLVLSLILTILAFTAPMLGDKIGPLEFKGTVTYTYPKGATPVTTVDYVFCDTVGPCIQITDTPQGWTNTVTGNTITLTGSSLTPGDKLVLGISLNKYVQPGEYEIQTKGTTSTGQVSQASGSLTVALTPLLYSLAVLNNQQMTMVMITMGLGFLEYILNARRKKVESVVPHLSGNPFSKPQTEPDKLDADLGSAIDNDIYTRYGTGSIGNFDIGIGVRSHWNSADAPSQPLSIPLPDQNISKGLYYTPPLPQDPAISLENLNKLHELKIDFTTGDNSKDFQRFLPDDFKVDFLGEGQGTIQNVPGQSLPSQETPIIKPSVVDVIENNVDGSNLEGYYRSYFRPEKELTGGQIVEFTGKAVKQIKQPVNYHLKVHRLYRPQVPQKPVVALDFTFKTKLSF